jgi:hypothetical protein
MKWLLNYIILPTLYISGGFGVSIFGPEQTCKVQIDNHQAEIKAMFEKHNQFNLNNWSHSSVIIIIGLLGILLFIICCHIRTKYWKVMKTAQKQSNHNQPFQFDGKDRPFIIYTKDKNNQYTRDEIQET